GGANNCGSCRWVWAEPDALGGVAGGGKKKRRGDRTGRPSARARNGWGSDQGSELAPPSHSENRPATPSAEDPSQRQHRTAVVETDGLLLASEPQEARIGEQELAAPTGAPSAVWLHRASAKTISGAGEPHHQRRCEKKGDDWKFQEPRGLLGEAAAVGHGSRLPQRRQRHGRPLWHLRSGAQSGFRSGGDQPRNPGVCCRGRHFVVEELRTKNVQQGQGT